MKQQYLKYIFDTYKFPHSSYDDRKTIYDEIYRHKSKRFIIKNLETELYSNVSRIAYSELCEATFTEFAASKSKILSFLEVKNIVSHLGISDSHDESSVIHDVSKENLKLFNNTLMKWSGSKIKMVYRNSRKQQKIYKISSPCSILKNNIIKT